jgi:hypothetical protein
MYGLHNKDFGGSYCVTSDSGVVRKAYVGKDKKMVVLSLRLAPYLHLSGGLRKSKEKLSQDS